MKDQKKKKKITCVGESKKSNRGSLNVCVFTKMSSKLCFYNFKTPKNVFSVSITYHLKIRKLSDGNKT